MVITSVFPPSLACLIHHINNRGMRVVRIIALHVPTFSVSLKKERQERKWGKRERKLEKKKEKHREREAGRYVCERAR